MAEYTDQALKLDPFDYPHEFPQNAYMKGLLALQHQDYASAVESLRTYLKLALDADDAEKVRKQLKEADK